MFDKEKCPVPELESRLVSGATHIAAATAAWLILLGAFDRRGGWTGYGIRSCAHWLSWKVGLGLRTAHEYLRVARALETLPVLREAFLAGQLSYTKVRALARVATVGNETELVSLARSMPAAHLERLVRAYRTVTKDEATARHQTRAVEWRHDDDGTVALRIRMPPEDGATLIAAITAAMDKATPPPDPTGTDPARGGGNPTRQQHTGARRADAVLGIAETYLATDRHLQSDPDRHTTIVHTDAATNPARPAGRAGEPGSGPVAHAHLGLSVPSHQELEDGAALHPDTIDRIHCDAPTITLTRLRGRRAGRRGRPGRLPGAPIGPGETLIDLGRRRRSPSAALRRAVHYRDQGHCQFPACPNSQFTDIHHIIPWHPDGRTDLASLLTLCRWHHRDHHEGGYAIALDPHGGPVFRRPDGTLIPQAPEPPPLTKQTGKDRTVAGERTKRPAPDPYAITPEWYGDPFDLHYTVAGLAHRHPTAA